MQYRYLLPTVLALARLGAAGQPACLLAALGQQEDPSSVEANCGKDKEDAMLSALLDACSDDDLPAALTQFVDTCGEKGIEVAALPEASKSGGKSESDKDGGGKEDAASGMAPSLIFLITGLAATSLTSIIFL